MSSDEDSTTPRATFFRRKRMKRLQYIEDNSFSGEPCGFYLHRGQQERDHQDLEADLREEHVDVQFTRNQESSAEFTKEPQERVLPRSYDVEENLDGSQDGGVTPGSDGSEPDPVSDSGEVDDAEIEHMSEREELVPVNRVATFSLDHDFLNNTMDFSQGVRARDMFMLTLGLSVRHNWTYENIIDNFKCHNALVEVSCLPKSKTKLWSIIRSQCGSELQYHLYCNKCFSYIGVKNDLPMEVECTKNLCGYKGLKSKMKYFIMLDLRSQFRNFLSIPGISEHLKYRQTRVKHVNDSVQDVYDGEEYKALVNEGIINPERDFTYVFNTDGVRVMKGSKLSAWPLYVRLNELAPNLRQKYLFLAGVWVDSSQPRMNLFLKPFVDHANSLSSGGIHWKLDGATTICSKLIPLCHCVDVKARWTLLNMTQYNGFHGCTYCDTRGVCSGTMRYPLLPPHHEPQPILWTNEAVEEAMIEAETSGVPFKGVKGVSALINLQHHKLITGSAQDDLHTLCERNAAHHTELLLHVSGVTRLGERAEIINIRLGKIKTPSCIARKPEYITKRGLWKGSEWRNWLLYYCLVCFKDLIPQKFIDHLALLSHASFLTSQDEITQEDLIIIERYLVKYVKEFEEYFGLDQMYYSVHLLSHFAACIKSWGPTWVYSTFNFESWNHQSVAQTVHSAQGVAEQIVHRHLIKTLVNFALYSDINISDATRQQLQDLLTTKTRNVSVTVGNVHFIGMELVRQSSDKCQVLLQEGYGMIEIMSEFSKILYQSIIYSNAVAKDARLKSDDSEIYTWQMTFCTVLSFVKFTWNTEVICGMYVEEHDVEPVLDQGRHVVQVKTNSSVLHFLKVSFIRSPVVSLHAAHSTFLVSLANCYEID